MIKVDEGDGNLWGWGQHPDLCEPEFQALMYLHIPKLTIREIHVWQCFVPL